MHQKRAEKQVLKAKTGAKTCAETCAKTCAKGKMTHVKFEEDLGNLLLSYQLFQEYFRNLELSVVVKCNNGVNLNLL